MPIIAALSTKRFTCVQIDMNICVYEINHMHAYICMIVGLYEPMIKHKSFDEFHPLVFPKKIGSIVFSSWESRIEQWIIKNLCFTFCRLMLRILV